MKKNGKAKPRKERVKMFPNARTVSFKMNEGTAKAATKAAYARQVPFSMWMREAAEEKLAKEAIAK